MIKSNDCNCVSVLQHLSISNGSTQVDASFMQTLWNIQPTCSSGNMAVGEESKRVVHMVKRGILWILKIDIPVFNAFNCQGT